MDDVFRGVGVDVDIGDDDNFLKIKETLTRIGVASKKDQKLYQSCHILHKRDKEGNSCYSIVHFKEMFKLDEKPSNMDDKDFERRNTIARLLEEWGLVEILNPEDVNDVAPVGSIKVLSFADKKNWELIAKYKIGKRK